MRNRSTQTGKIEEVNIDDRHIEVRQWARQPEYGKMYNGIKSIFGFAVVEGRTRKGEMFCEIELVFLTVG